MSRLGHKAIIIGGGIAGLSAAKELERFGVHDVLLLEAQSKLGGKVQTDLVNGFTLDRGFHVGFSRYPHLQDFAPRSVADRHIFEPGALIYNGERLIAFGKNRPTSTLVSGIMSPPDLLRLLELSKELVAWSKAEDGTAEHALQAIGFSQSAIDLFFRPFLGGVFLNRDLQFSAQQLAFIWTALSDGHTFWPERGIAALPVEVAESLVSTTVRTGVRVSRVDCSQTVKVGLESGEELSASAVIFALDAAGIRALLPNLVVPFDPISSTTIYFDADSAPVDRKAIILNASGHGLVNQVVPLSNVQPHSAPLGRHLVSVTVLGNPKHADRDLAEAIKRELESWFPNRNVPAWQHLATYRIADAQYNQPPNFKERRLPVSLSDHGYPNGFLAGVYTTNCSVDGAIESGILAAGLAAKRIHGPSTS